jgi:hypothetical protein
MIGDAYLEGDAGPRVDQRVTEVDVVEAPTVRLRVPLIGDCVPDIELAAPGWNLQLTLQLEVLAIERGPGDTAAEPDPRIVAVIAHDPSQDLATLVRDTPVQADVLRSGQGQVVLRYRAVCACAPGRT